VVQAAPTHLLVKVEFEAMFVPLPAALNCTDPVAFSESMAWIVTVTSPVMSSRPLARHIVPRSCMSFGDDITVVQLHV
jgi:hypothetical protein